MGVLRTSGGLVVVPEAGQIEVDRHLLRKLRRGRSRSEEERRLRRCGRSGGEHRVGVAQPEQRRDLAFEQLRRRRREGGRIGLPIGDQQVQRTAQQAARRVDLRRGELGAVPRRLIERRLAAGEIVDGAKHDRTRRTVRPACRENEND